MWCSSARTKNSCTVAVSCNVSRRRSPETCPLPSAHLRFDFLILSTDFCVQAFPICFICVYLFISIYTDISLYNKILFVSMMVFCNSVSARACVKKSSFLMKMALLLPTLATWSELRGCATHPLVLSTWLCPVRVAQWRMLLPWADAFWNLSETASVTVLSLLPCTCWS